MNLVMFNHKSDCLLYVVLAIYAVIVSSEKVIGMGSLIRKVNLFILVGYRKIPIVSPGLYLFERLFSWTYFREAYFRGGLLLKEFCVSKWVGLHNKNSLKHYENSLKQLKTTNANSPWAYILEGLLSEGFLRLRFAGLIFGRA